MEKVLVAPKLRFENIDHRDRTDRFEYVIDSILYGPRFSSDDYDLSGNVKTIRGTDIEDNCSIDYQKVPIALLPEELVERHKIAVGDLIMITTAECGQTGLLESSDYPYIASAYAVRIKLNDKAYPRYFKYVFQTWHIKKEINSFIRKATVANLPGSDIPKIKSIIPSLPEQQKIADFLSTVDSKIDALTRRHELLQQYKKGMMQRLFPAKGEKNPQLRFKQEDGSDFPDWEEKMLGLLSEIKAGYAFSSSKMTTSGKYQLIKMTNVYKGILDLNRSPSFLAEVSNKEKAFLLNKGESVLTLTGTVGKRDFGYSVQIPISNELLLNQRLVRIRKIDGLSTNNFIYSLIQTNRFYYHFFNEAKGGTGNQTNVGIEDLKRIKLNLPCLSEQRRIADLLSILDRKVETISTQIEQMKTWKRGLLQKMFV